MGKAAASRRYPRVRRMRPAYWRDSPGPGCSFLRLDLVGRGGALLRCDGAIEPDTPMELEICLAGGVICVRARVVYCRPQDAGYEVGVEFVDLEADSEELLEQLIAG